MRLIVATNSGALGTAARNALTAFLEAKGWSVWHWYEELWLLDNVPPEINLSQLRVEIQRAIPALTHILILSAEGAINHSGMVPSQSVAWFVEHWRRRP